MQKLSTALQNIHLVALHINFYKTRAKLKKFNYLIQRYSRKGGLFIRILGNGELTGFALSHRDLRVVAARKWDQNEIFLWPRACERIQIRLKFSSSFFVWLKQKHFSFQFGREKNGVPALGCSHINNITFVVSCENSIAFQSR
jgi:hypothetical protein